MPNLLQYIALAVTHPAELRAVVHRSVFMDVRDIKTDKSSGYERPTMKRCWELLDHTSRSFAAVIKELDDDLCRVVCLFYLVLRGLDTVEDDMTLDLDLKTSTLESFHEKLTQPGWNFTQSGPNEHDRDVLIEFDKVIQELMTLDERYMKVITHICKCMGAGMAHYARVGAKSTDAYAVDTLADFDLYCHYVAGLVGEGVSGLFSASGKEAPEIGRMLTLSNSMGLFLQKTNIMRDFREDLEDGRFFWPTEIWSKYTSDPREFYLKGDDPEVRRKGLAALNEVILDVLVHAIDSLNYLSLLKNQSIFQFCAIPQVMAIATLEICFNNPDVFHKNVKIRRSTAVYLINRATNVKEVAKMYVQYARKIVKRAPLSDPSYLKICIACGQIEQWLETYYPSWLFLPEGGVRSPLPIYSDEKGLEGVEDIRLRQLPAMKDLPEQRERDARLAAYRATNEISRMSGRDYLILFSFASILMIVMLTLMAMVATLVWYYTDPDASSTKLIAIVSSIYNNWSDQAKTVGIPIVGSFFRRPASKEVSEVVVNTSASLLSSVQSAHIVSSTAIARPDL